MRTFFLACSAVSSIFIALLGIIAISEYYNPSPAIKVNYEFVCWALGLHCFAWFMCIVTIGTYFGNDIWKSKEALDEIKFDLAKKDKQLDRMIAVIGEHEAVKIYREKYPEKTT